MLLTYRTFPDILNMSVMSWEEIECVWDLWHEWKTSRFAVDPFAMEVNTIWSVILSRRLMTFRAHAPERRYASSHTSFITLGQVEARAMAEDKKTRPRSRSRALGLLHSSSPTELIDVLLRVCLKASTEFRFMNARIATNDVQCERCILNVTGRMTAQTHQRGHDKTEWQDEQNQTRLGSRLRLSTLLRFFLRSRLICELSGGLLFSASRLRQYEHAGCAKSWCLFSECNHYLCKGHCHCGKSFDNATSSIVVFPICVVLVYVISLIVGIIGQIQVTIIIAITKIALLALVAILIERLVHNQGHQNVFSDHPYCTWAAHVTARELVNTTMMVAKVPNTSPCHGSQRHLRQWW